MKTTAHRAGGPSPDVGREIRSCTPVGPKLPRPRHEQPRRLVRDSIANLLSYLGPSNPWPQPVTEDDELWLMDNAAFPTTRKDKDGRVRTVWEAEFVAAVFLQHPSCSVSDAVVAIAERLGLAGDEQARRTIETRLRPFLMDIRPGRQVLALHGGSLPLRLGAGGRSGISLDRRAVVAAPAGAVVATTAQVPAGTTGVLRCETFFADPDGWAVVSDVDDTVKVTLTADRAGVLRSTLVDDPRPVPGMPALYAHLRAAAAAATAAGAGGPAFFYLSASPYNLYPFLRGFLRGAGYPPGPLLLRDASWRSPPGLVAGVLGTASPRAYKVARLRRLRARLPGARVVCVGDSTQGDPEAYARLYRDRGGAAWVRLVLIRRVAGVAAAEGGYLEGRNRPERFEAAFRGVPRHVWHVFDDPSECHQIIRDVVGST